MLTSTEFFINADVPPPHSKEYESFWNDELYKIENGVTVNGIHYTNWLYWHLNHWYMLIDGKPKPNGKIPRILSLGQLRDNEWIIAEGIARGEKEKKGVLIVGSRRFGKTEIEASYIGYNAISGYGTENMVGAGNDPDLNKIIGSIKRGFKNLHPYLKPIFLEDRWGSGNDVVLGFKDQSGERYEYSKVLLRNHNGGKNTESGAGATLSSFVIDEVGKDDWLSFFDAVKPAFESEYGWRLSPIATGTTGNMEKARELEEVYHDMETHGFIRVELKDDKGNPFHFFPGHMSLKFPKKEIKLRDYLDVWSMNEDTIRVTQWDLAREMRNKELAALEKTGKQSSIIKFKMYYPFNEDEMFLTDDTDNPFADVIPFAREQLNYLIGMTSSGEEYGYMTRDSGTNKPKFEHTDKKPIGTWPTAKDEDKDAPIIIWNHPLPGQQFGVLHVGGSDPYNQDESYYSPSLGTIYIYRRTYDPINGVGQEQFVASYSARPKSIAKWREQVRLLMEYYGCTVLPENEEASFIRHFDEKNLGHWIEDGLDLAKEINPNTKVKRNKGLSASPANIRYGNGVLRNHCLEDIVIGQDPATGEPITKKGVVRIKDKMLLTEIIGYKKPRAGKPENADRVVAARHALILAKSKDKLFPLAKVTPPYEKQDKPKIIVRSPFAGSHGGSAFSKSKTPFKRGYFTR